MADEIKDFGLGTLKGFIGKAGKGALYGVGIAAVLAVGSGVLLGGLVAGAIGTGIVAAASGIASGIMVTGAVGFLTGIPIVQASASIGAAYGGITGGAKEMRKTAQAERDALAVQSTNLDYEIKSEKKMNQGLRNALSQKERAAQYQVPNPMAEGKADNHFQSQFAAQETASKEMAQGGVGK